MSNQVPTRLVLPPTAPDEIRRFCALCDEIENRIASGDDGDLPRLLALWNERASRPYEPYDFTSYHGSMSQEVFVRVALDPQPMRIADLRFDEICCLIGVILDGRLSESESTYYLALLKINLPNSEISDLIYWPNHWFGREAPMKVDLTAMQIAGYAMLRSGRQLDGAPEKLDLPLPMPRLAGERPHRG